MRDAPAGQSLRRRSVRVVAIATAVIGVSSMAAASPAVSEDVPVPGGIAALARSLGVEPPDRARCVAELARLIYADSKAQQLRPGSRFRRLLAYLEEGDHTRSVSHSVAADLVPMPLPATVWSRTIFQRPVATADLFAAVMSDPNAALLAYGLAALDDETLAFLAAQPALLRHLYERDAPIVAAFAAHLHIRDGRVEPPGGETAASLWEALLNERVTRPDAFVRELYARNKGRLAYLYDVIGHLDSARASFALGLRIEDAAVRVNQFKTLAMVASSAFSEWQVRRLPFTRPTHDILSMFSRVDIAGRRDVGFTAANLAKTMMSGHARQRAERLDQFAFGQRVFAASNSLASADALAVMQAFPRFRMLMLTLERIGMKQPQLYARLARHAEHLSALDAKQGRAALAEFQGAIALIARMARVKTIDAATAERLLGTLGALAINPRGGYHSAFAKWLRVELRPAVSADIGKSLETVLIDALAGPRSRKSVRRVSWENQDYVFDLVASEAGRLRRFRARQGGLPIDAALDVHRLAERLAAVASDDRGAVGQLADRLLALVNTLIADALVSIAYAIDWSDPPGSGRFAGDVARRHDFGFERTHRERRVRTAWTLPAQVFERGIPWHVQGALLGLDVALAPLALRRISADAMPAPAAMSDPDRDAFVNSLGLLNAFALHDDSQRAIAEAIARGREIVESLPYAGRDLSAVIRQIEMDGWRARALRWTIAHEPQRAASLFSLTELLYLGGGRELDLHAWGMSALNMHGCLCTRMLPPSHHTALVGRPHLGLLASATADLNLRTAVTLHELRLPAALAKTVLAAAVQEFVDGAKPSDPDDWLALVRAAQAISRERIEDYFAAATWRGPLVPASSTRPLPW